MNFIFGYQLIKDVNITINEIYQSSKMYQFEIDELRENMIANFGEFPINNFINKMRLFFENESEIQELICLLKEEEFLKDDEFYSRFQINLQRKMRTSFLKKDIETIKGYKIKDLVPFYNRLGGFYGIKIETENNREIWIRFHGVPPSRNSLFISEKGDRNKRISSVTINNVNQPKKQEGVLEIEIPEEIKSEGQTKIPVIKEKKKKRKKK
jgi:hypothetical protein